MSLHPQLQAMLDKTVGLPPMQTVPIETIRAGDLKRYEIGVPKDIVASAEDREIKGPRGPIRLRIYRPDDSPGLPILMFFHGSGFCICSIDTHDAMCRQIARRSGAIVVSVDYRLAPENKFPAGPDDCHRATLWAHEHAEEFGGDATRMAVCGDSAGGTMAALVARRLSDEDGPALLAQMLFYPVTDHYSAGHPSYVERGLGYGLTADGMRYFWDMYLADPRQGVNANVSPLRGHSFVGLPATYLITGEYDVLRDEGEAYASKLSEASVSVTLKRYHDMNHGFLNWVGLIDRATEAMDDAGRWIKARLSP